VKTTLDTAKEALATMTAAYNTWIKLGFWVDEDLKFTYKKSLETGKNNLQEGAKILDQLMGNLGLTEMITPTDRCLLDIPLFDGDRLVQGGNFIKQKISQLSTTWTPDEVKTNQKNNLDLFVMSFNTISWDFLVLVKTSLKNLELIQNQDFPTEWLGALEKLDCITKPEVINIMDCTSGSNLVYCILIVLTPTTPAIVNLLEPINYKGVELFLEPNQFLMKEMDNSRIYILNCSQKNDLVSYPFVFCQHLDEDSTACHTALLIDDIEEAIKLCRFKFAVAKRPFKLLNDGILIQSLDFTVTNGDTVIKNTPPIVIVSNGLVKASRKTESYGFLTMVPLSLVGTYKSKLTSSHLLNLQIKATWDNFYYSFNLFDYLEHLALILHIIFAPISILACCLTFKHRKRENNKTTRKQDKIQRKGKHRELRAFLRSERL
jgi:hypothetical protein